MKDMNFFLNIRVSYFLHIIRLAAGKDGALCHAQRCAQKKNLLLNQQFHITYLEFQQLFF